MWVQTLCWQSLLNPFSDWSEKKKPLFACNCRKPQKLKLVYQLSAMNACVCVCVCVCVFSICVYVFSMCVCVCLACVCACVCASSTMDTRVHKRLSMLCVHAYVCTQQPSTSCSQTMQQHLVTYISHTHVLSSTHPPPSSTQAKMTTIPTSSPGNCTL